MRLSLFALAVAAPVAVCACSSPKECSTLVVDRSGAPATAPVQFVTVGDRVSQRIELFTALTASCDVPAVDWVRAEVFDPNGAPVPSDARVVSDSGVLPAIAEVSFDATETGTFHVRAVFEPNLGSAQTDLMVGRDLTVHPLATLGEQCPELSLLDNGSFLCGDRLVRPDGTVTGLVYSSSVAVGEVIWSVGLRRVVRYEDSGSGRPDQVWLDGVNGDGSPEQSVAGSDFRFLIATSDDFLVLSDQGVQRIVFENGTIRGNGRIYGAGGEEFEALYRDGDDVWMLNERSTDPRVEQVTACHFSLSTMPAYGELTEPCQTLDGNLRGVDESGVWLSHGDPQGAVNAAASISLTVFKAEQGELRPVSSYRVPAGYIPHPPTHLRYRFQAARPTAASVGGVPSLTIDGRMVRLVPGPAYAPGSEHSDLVFERFSRELGDGLPGVRGNLAWVSSASQRNTTVFDRGR